MRSLMEFFFGVKRSKKSGRKANKVSAGNGMDFMKAAFTKPSPKGLSECLQVQEPISVTYTWKIEGWSKIKESQIMSNSFRVGEYNCLIGICPQGSGVCKNKSVCMFIQGLKTQPLLNKNVYIKCTATMKDQLHGNHKSLTYHAKLGKERRRSTMFELSAFEELNNPSKGLLVKDTCILEAVVTFVGYWS